MTLCLNQNPNSALPQL